jgi:type VI secretion system protein VasD
MTIKYRIHQLLGLITILLSMSGCVTVDAVTAVADAAMQVTGIKKPAAPELPDSQKAPRTIQINLHAADNLNADASGRALALVAKVYKLRQNAAFQQATYDTFLNPQKEKEALGTDLLEVKEITLVPGQLYHAEEKVSREAYFIGVVGLFRTPAAQRWRATFPADAVEKTGITIGMHACSLTVGTGLTINEPIQNKLSTVRCP